MFQRSRVLARGSEAVCFEAGCFTDSQWCVQEAVSLSEQRSVHLQNDKSKQGADYDYNQILVTGSTLQWILERMNVLHSLSFAAVTPQRKKTITENGMVMCDWLPSGSVAWPSGRMGVMVTNHVREDS